MLKIMVVDDEHDIELLFRQQFRKEIRQGKLHFHFAFSGSQAIEYIQSDDSTDLVLILSDINMPGMSGLELLRYIKRQRPELQVYMITAYDDPVKHQRAIDDGAAAYMTKPLNFKTLKEVLHDFERNTHG